MDEVQQSLKNRYPDLHPLLFHRSAERARTNGELFDLLEGMPTEFPVVWDARERRWQHTDNLLQARIKGEPGEGELSD